jgi:hypothetical protein
VVIIPSAAFIQINLFWVYFIFFIKSGIFEIIFCSGKVSPIFPVQPNKIFFDLLKHIQDNWNHYRFNYKIDQTYFRNDYAFSIAIHIMNGFGIGNFANPMPGKLYFLSDREYIVDYNKNSFLFLLQNKLTEHYFLNRTKDFNVHVLNKFSLDKIVNKNING